MLNKLKVRINSPAKIVWEGDADSVSSENTQGVFDILPLHTNFLSFVEKKPVVVRTSKGNQIYNYDRMVIYAKENKVNIYTNF